MLVLALAGHVAAQAPGVQALRDRDLLSGEPDESARYWLWNDCRPVPVHLSVLRNNLINEADADLEETLLAAVGARLQRERLHKAEDSCVKCSGPRAYGKPYLMVLVHLEPGGVGRITIDTALFKLLQDRASGVSRYAVTWERRWEGSGSVAQLAQLLSEGIDNFVAVYLHVNESACGDPGR